MSPHSSDLFGPGTGLEDAATRTGRPGRRAVVGSALLSAALTLAPRESAKSEARPHDEQATTTATPTQRFGAYIPDPYWDWTGWPNALNAFTARTGQAPSVVHWFAQWAGQPDFPDATARKIRSRGALPMLTWEPWNWSGGAVQSAYRLSQITAGAFDAYLRSFASQVKAFGSTLYLRFAPEMNGDWNPWSEKVNGNRPGDYVRAWNHVRSVFASAAVTNVRWVWMPIVNHWGSTPLPGLFPGSAAVDIVGLDGYNWGTTKTTSTWQTFSQVFETSLAQVHAMSTKPLWLGEVGCTEQGGNKAAWVTDMFARLRTDTRVSALVWFDANKETDWRINSTPATLTAFQKGIAAAHFVPAG